MATRHGTGNGANGELSGVARRGGGEDECTGHPVADLARRREKAGRRRREAAQAATRLAELLTADGDANSVRKARKRRTEAERRAVKAERKLAAAAAECAAPGVASRASGGPEACRSTGARKKTGKGGGDHVYLCRGCCCGTAKKHPGIDHDRVKRLLRDGCRAAGVGFTVTDCLGPCGQGNLLVARTGGETLWFRKMNHEAAVSELLGQLSRPSDTAAGRPLPAGLARHRMPKRDGDRPRW